MKITLFFSFCLLLIPICSKAQNSTEFSGYVYSNETKLPIQYATIELIDNNIGALTNKQGYFSMFLTEKNKNGLLNIRMLGYKPQSQDLNSFIKSKKDTIYLIKDTINLTEVIINSQDANCPQEFIGINEKSNAVFLENVGSQIAVFCKNINPNKNGKINSLRFYIKSGGKYNAPFRVRIYDVGEAGNPGRELLKENLVVTANKKKWFDVNVDSLNISVPKLGFFIAMEWIFTDESYYYLSEANRKKYTKQQYGQSLGAIEGSKLDNYTYIKSLGKGWSKVVFPFLQEVGKSYNALINAKVTYSCQE